MEHFEHLLFVVYLILFAWLVTKVKFFTHSGLTKSQLIIFFLLKVMAGIFYGWIGVYYGEMAKMIDTWAYHQMSLEETELLKSDPVQFFNLFGTSYQEGYANFLYTQNSWWNDIKATFLIKIMAVLNLFSAGYYYVNVIFYSFLTLFGPIALYRVMKEVYPTKKTEALLGCFLIPSFLYWTSGLHKEGLIFLGLALILYHFYFSFKEKRLRIAFVLWTLFGFFLILLLRNFLIVILIPPLIAWIIAQKTRARPVWVYLIVYAISVSLFFLSKYIHPKFDFPQATVVKQEEFLKLSGGSTVEVNKLEPTVSGFLKNAPQAITISTIRPFPSDVKNLLSLAAAIEIYFLLLLFLIFLFSKKQRLGQQEFVLFGIFFSAGVLFMIGYTVNNLGAIVRYRSIVLPLLMIPVIVQIDWKKIYGQVFGDINNNINY